MLPLWGFPLWLYNSAPVGLTSHWQLPQSTRPGLARPGPAPDQTEPTLSSALFLAPAVLLQQLTLWFYFAFLSFFISLFLFFFLFFLTFPFFSWMCLASGAAGLSLPPSGSLSLLSVDVFFLFCSSCPPPAAEEAVRAVMYETSWHPPASQPSLWRGFWKHAIGCSDCKLSQSIQPVTCSDST